MSEQMLVQCRLLRGTTTLVSWLDSRKKFRVGNYVTLKGLDGRWEIKTIGRPIAASNIHHDWNNNI